MAAYELLDPNAPQRCYRASREMMACCSAESHAHPVGGQSNAAVACWDSLISNDISLQLPDWEGAEGRESTHATTTAAATTTTISLYHHHTTLPPPHDMPSRRSGLTSVHITLSLLHAAYDTHYLR